MTKKLIIVESPAKIKTLRKFLDSSYELASSVGHIRDLPEKSFGIDLENGEFTPTYEVLPDKTDVVRDLKKAAAKADVVILSPDPDREGEAIAWHIAELLPKDTKIVRVAFNAITKSAVKKALEEPRDIDQALVNAQQARRFLDRIVGYKISPILNRRIQRGKNRGVSAGRVQSVALKLVVEREKEIEAFRPQEHWNLGANLATEKKEGPFFASLFSVDGEKIERPDPEKETFFIKDEATAKQIAARLEKGPFRVSTIEKRERKRNPVAPFITSTLQQEASRHFGYSAQRTMSIAQGLYEGVDLGPHGQEGLITYMRTDSVRISPEALSAVRSIIEEKFGKKFLPEKPRFYSTKKSAQDAHEAIRPSDLQLEPQMIESYLTPEQFKLYSLIWRRFVSSQMEAAIYDTVSANIDADEGLVLRATGSTLKFKGFLAAYEEKRDEEEDPKSLPIPPMEEGQSLMLQEITKEQAFTRPPPRYTEASLVKELEKSGIGRPSTYAAIMNKIQSRDYTIKESRRLKPTEIGRVISDLLDTNFTQIMQVDFTARMEDALESIAEDQSDWKELLGQFWKTFSVTLETAEKEAFVPKILTDRDCPKCKNKLQKVWYRDRYFYGCSQYPECDFSSPIESLDFKKEDYHPDFDWEQPCPKCEAEMTVRHGRYGPFLGCTNYPDCRGIVNVPGKNEEPIIESNLPACPAIGCDGKLTARRSRFGKIFFSCSNYPECDVICNSLDQLATKYVDHPKTPYEKKTRKGAKGGAKGKAKKGAAKKTTKKRAAPTGKPTPLSPELAAVIGSNEATRNEVRAKIWEYIKRHSLQDPKDGRMIIPDEKLAKVFGSAEPVSMFQMAKLLMPHMK